MTCTWCGCAIVVDDEGQEIVGNDRSMNSETSLSFQQHLLLTLPFQIPTGGKLIE